MFIINTCLFGGLAELNTGAGAIYQEGEGCFVMDAPDKDLSKHIRGFRYERCSAGFEIRENYTQFLFSFPKSTMFTL